MFKLINSNNEVLLVAEPSKENRKKYGLNLSRGAILSCSIFRLLKNEI